MPDHSSQFNDELTTPSHGSPGEMLPAEEASRNRILVVDDIADNSFLLQIVLEGEGYEVDVVDNGRAALNEIAANPPDLVLLDVMMPGMNGFEVTQRVRQNPVLPFIPILLITGYAELTPAEGLEVGADGLIRKPIDPDYLLQRVRAVLQYRYSLSDRPAP